MDIDLIDNIEWVGSGVDLYLFSAAYNGFEMTIEELGEISNSMGNVEYWYNKFI